MKVRSIPIPRYMAQSAFVQSLPGIGPAVGGYFTDGIKPQHVISQLKQDLIGKDSHRGVTLTYTWLANQFGHFSLGFIPSLILAYMLAHYTDYTPPVLWASIFVGGFWVVFELFNFLGPLIADRAVARFSIERSGYPFTPAWGNIAFDTLTDVLFFCLGAFSAALFQQSHLIVLELTIMLVVGLVPASYYWYVTKMYQQQAGFPRQIRIGQWSNRIDEVDRATVERFIRDSSGGQHLLVFGTERSGKTPLSIAIATEKTIQHQSCLYISAMKLLSMFSEREQSDSEDGWTWRSVSTLVIDDINPGESVHRDFIKPQTFARLLLASPCGALNREALRSKNVIWVLGTDRPDGALQQQWMAMLLGLDIDPGDIQCINLSRAGSSHQAV